MEVTAYCFMPDHLHLLTTGESEHADLRRFVRALKQRTGFEHSREFKTTLWQRYYWDHVLRTDEDVWTLIRYILANPVRAGIVARPLEFAYSGSLRFSREELIAAFDECRAG